jgi:hypothetical protein
MKILQREYAQKSFPSNCCSDLYRKNVGGRRDSPVMPLCFSQKSYYFMALKTPVGPGLLTIEASQSHSDTPHSVGLLWSSVQPDAETSAWQHTTPKTYIFILLTGIEPAILVSESPQTHTLNGAVIWEWYEKPHTHSEMNPGLLRWIASI